MAASRIMEDDPRWNARTMGNRIGGKPRAKITVPGGIKPPSGGLARRKPNIGPDFGPAMPRKGTRTFKPRYYH